MIDDKSERLNYNSIINSDRRFYMIKRIFISHSVDEKELAKLLKEDLEERFMGAFEIFVSSDGKSIDLGSEWFESIKSNLNNADIMLVLCSKNSISKPWIPFEIGAGWMKGIKTIPICHTDLIPGQLPSPINALQAISVNDGESLINLYNILLKMTGLKIPNNILYDTDNFLLKITNYEEYQLFTKIVENSIDTLERDLPELKGLFSISNINKHLEIQIREYYFNLHKPIFDLLNEKGVIRYSIPNQAGSTFTNLGQVKIMNIVVTEKFREFVNLLNKYES